jgi:hypothetical protein
MRSSIRGLVAVTLLTAWGTVTQAEIVLDDPSAALSGTWNYRTTGSHPGAYGSGSYFAFGDATATANYTATIPAAGVWSVEMWWNRGGHNNSYATPVTITHAEGTTGLTVDQNYEQGERWVALGTFNFDAGTEASLLIDNTGAPAVPMYNVAARADAVRFARAGVDTLTDVVIDSQNGTDVPQGAGPNTYAETGSWFNSTYNAPPLLYDNEDRLSNTLGSVATFDAPLALAKYEVQVTWNPVYNRSENALYELVDWEGAVHTFRFDQTGEPGDDTGWGQNWARLGIFPLNSTSQVRLVADALAVDEGRDYVVADGVRFIYDSPFPTQQAVPEPSTLLVWSLLAGLGVGAAWWRRAK